MYSILTIVASTYAPQFPDVVAGQSFVKRLIGTFLTGFGIAAGVSLCIFPMTSRTLVSKQMGGLLGLLKVALIAHDRYVQSIPMKNYAPQDKDGSLLKLNIGAAKTEADKDPHENRDKKRKIGESPSKLSPEAKTMKKALFEVGALFGKIHLELGFAKKELAYGKLGPDDLGDISSLLRNIMLPVVGMATFTDILETVKNKKLTEMGLLDSEGPSEAVKKLKTEEWDEIMTISHASFQKLNEAMQDGLTHISYVLELTNRPKKAARDVEKPSEHPGPGEDGFCTYLENEVRSVETQSARTLKAWCERKGIELSTTFWDDPRLCHSLRDELASACLRQKENQQQLYLVLYVEYLTYSIGRSILEMVRYSDGKVADGTMTKKRMIFPGWKRIHKWIKRVFDPEDTGGTDDGGIGGASIWIGDSLKAEKDPEHLPPRTFLQKSTNYIRAIPRFFSSPESS